MGYKINWWVFCFKIIETLELKSLENKSKIINVGVNKKISQFIEENFLKNIEYFEKKNKLKINILSNEHLSPSEYSISFQSKSKKIIEKLEKIIELKIATPKSKEDEKYIKITNRKNKNKRKKFFRKKFYKKN